MGKRILIIEDEKHIRDNLEELLESEGYNVTLSVNGKDGVERAKAEQFDLILCDIMMPELDGIEVFTTLNESGRLKRTPFIFLTAKAEMTDLRIGMQIGADDYIVKPYKQTDILRSIEARLRRIEENHDLQAEKSEENGKSKKLGLRDKIMMRYGNRQTVVPIEEIICVIAYSEHTKIHTHDGKTYIIRKLIKEWEDVLPEDSFLRVHRSTIINTGQIESVAKDGARSLKLKLKGLQSTLTVSQRYSTHFKKSFSF